MADTSNPAGANGEAGMGMPMSRFKEDVEPENVEDLQDESIPRLPTFRIVILTTCMIMTLFLGASSFLIGTILMIIDGKQYRCHTGHSCNGS
jgi:hypothetical protein